MIVKVVLGGFLFGLVAWQLLAPSTANRGAYAAVASSHYGDPERDSDSSGYLVSTQTAIAIPRPLATQTAQAFERNPQCLSGAGLPLPSSLGNGKFSDKIALELMHGNEGLLVVCTIEDFSPAWPIDQPYFAVINLRENVPEQVRYQAIIEFKMVFAAPVSRQDIENGPFVVITHQRCYGCNCHACPVPIWGGVFERKNGQWRTVIEPQKVTEFGQWGFVQVSGDRAKLFDIGPDRFGVLLRSELTGFGTTTDASIMISEVDGKLKQILPSDIVLAEDNSGNCGERVKRPCYEFDSEIGVKVGRNPEFYDLIVYTQGTGESGKDITGSTLYEFRNGNYVKSILQNE